ncbi:hypothetical protein Tco_0409202 [Tanacetum coccineum]
MENSNDYGWGLGSVVAMVLVVVAMLFLPLGMGTLAPPSFLMILVIPVLTVVNCRNMSGVGPVMPGYVRGGKLRGHIPGVGPVMPGYVRSRLSYTAPVDRSRDVDFMMNLMRSDNRFADAFARYDSGGASGSGGSRARDSDDTGGEDGGDDTS